MAETKFHEEKQRPIRILLAEDDEAMRNFVASVLKQDGYDVVEISNGSELAVFFTDMALATQGDNDPGVDIVVSDIYMPGRTAFEVLQSFRQAIGDIPIILVTAFGDPVTHERALVLGATVVFDKPFDVDELKQTLFDLTLPYRCCDAAGY